MAVTGIRQLDAGGQLRLDAEELHAALTALVRVYQFRDRDGICCHDLSVTQYYALDALIERGPSTLGGLAAALYLEKSTMSRIVDGLERKLHVERRPHPEDGRALLLQPTRAGRIIHDRIRAETLAQQQQLLAEFDPEVRQATARLIARLARAVADQVRSTGAACCILPE